MITIITPTLNAAETLSRCIDSVKSQGVVEHLFIDGGSTDGTREILGAFIDAPGSNIYEAQNIGIQASRNQWLYFLGADDWLYPNALKQLQPILKVTTYRWLHGKIQIEPHDIFRYNGRQQSFIYHKSLYKDFGMYDTTDLGGDVRFNGILRIAKEPLEKIDVNLAHFSMYGTRRRLNAST